MSWHNPDNLLVKFGPEEVTPVEGGELPTDGTKRVVQIKLTLTDLGSSSAILEKFNGVVIPSGVIPTKVRVTNHTAATSGGSATLNLGLIRMDRSTTYDVDAFLAAAPLADYNAAGEIKEYVIGVSGVGSAVGTVLANPGLLVADYDTAAYTAGEVIIDIEFYVPRPLPA